MFYEHTVQRAPYPSPQMHRLPQTYQDHVHACSKKILLSQQQKNSFPWQQLICKVQSALNTAVDLSGEERVDLQIIQEAAMEF